MESPTRDHPTTRSPELIQTAINTIAELDTKEFEDFFGDFAELTRETAREHRTCNHPVPLILSGVDLSESSPGIKHVSDPSIIDAPPTEPHLDKPEHLQHYDVIAIVQANDFLDEPEHIQGALIESLSSQWHIVSMLTDIFGEHATDALIDQAQSPDELDTLLDNLYNTSHSSDSNYTELTEPDIPTPHPMDYYPKESLEHLIEYENGAECRYCSAFYFYDEMQEALNCCPSS